jgi:ribonucleotide monophosphatase NagD (HAD superfamily)
MSDLPSTNPPLVHMHTSFRDIVDQYDAFILDQFGVLHNGEKALDGAVELVKHLYKAKKKLIILSNTSSPSRNALLKLPTLGFQAEWFVDAVTSGEEASRFVRATYGDRPLVRVLFFTWDARIANNPRLTAPPQAFLDACGDNIQVTDRIAEADVILLHGSEIWYRGEEIPPISIASYLNRRSWDDIDPLLEQFLPFKIPMVCANPDQIVVTPSGGTAYMPGGIAQRYQALGGPCRIFGKPDVEHFGACLRTLGGRTSGDAPRVAHVGDSLHHDIGGAKAAGIPSVFVTSGIHARQLGTQFGEMPNVEALFHLFQTEGSIYPTHVVPAFRL